MNMIKTTRLTTILMAVAMMAALMGCSSEEKLKEAVNNVARMCPLSSSADGQHVITAVACVDGEVYINVEFDEHNPATYAHELWPAAMAMDRNNNWSRDAVHKILSETESGKALIAAIASNKAPVILRCKGKQTGSFYQQELAASELE